MGRKSTPRHTYEELSALYHYDPETGYLYSRKTGWKVGGLTKQGYRRIGLREHGKTHGYAVHRIAWLLVHGVWPTDLIDHINGIRHDNRLCNLREATNKQNLQSRPRHKRNKLGVKGVIRFKNKYRAQCWHDGKFVLRQAFDTIEEAAAAYQAKAAEVFGEWNRPD
jgi:hypothetical protein